MIWTWKVTTKLNDEMIECNSNTRVGSQTTNNNKLIIDAWLTRTSNPKP